MPTRPAAEPARPDTPPADLSGPDAVVLGASFAGLFATAALAGTGRRVTVVERDRLVDDDAPRPGVPQGTQAHVLLHRGLSEAERLLPGLRDELEAAGAVRIDTGRLPWYGPLGWQPTDRAGHEIWSLTRPRLERLVRQRVRGLAGVTLRDGVAVEGLEPLDPDRPLTGPHPGWRVLLRDSAPLDAPLVVDATGRGSRLTRWLEALGVATEPAEELDAGVGYLTRRYRRPDGLPVPGAAVVASSPDQPRGGLALPVEDGGYLVALSGFGEHRPRRSDGRAFAAGLRDPLIAELLDRLEPVGEAVSYGRTGNRRHRHARRAGWPEGLLVLGDALCTFDPVYGQGITVAAIQAGRLAHALGPVGARRRTPALQRRLSAAADLPWSIATGIDRQYLRPAPRPPLPTRVWDAWTTALYALVVAGDARATTAFDRLYHLHGSPRELMHPALLLAVLARRGAPVPVAPRPDPDALLGDPPIAREELSPAAG